jgi:hypothetical protein
MCRLADMLKMREAMEVILFQAQHLFEARTAPASRREKWRCGTAKAMPY